MPKTKQKKAEISRSVLRSIKDDAAKTVKTIGLVYITDQRPGITRVRKGSGFTYYFKQGKVTDKGKLRRIKGLVVPPAWEKVWISPLENSHLQATGYDIKRRKQYIYHPLWIALRSKTKFHRLYQFGRSLPRMRKHLQKDLRLHSLSRRKVLAALVKIMEKTNIRVGSETYEKLYGSLGLSTLKNRNVKVKGNRMRFTFRGKKGVKHDISLYSKRLTKIVHRCREIPGQELFQYVDENEQVQAIDSGDVNEYIREISGAAFISKDFRTWEGSVACIKAFKKIGFGGNKTALKKNTVLAIDMVAESLGNTRAICKKYYIHPSIFDCYENGLLETYFQQAGKGSKWMEPEESVLMKIVK